MTSGMTVYIVVRQGPEWTDIIKCFECRKAALASANHRNKNRDPKDIYERLSHYEVIPMGVVRKGH